MLVSAYIYVGEGRFKGLREGDADRLTHVNISFALVKDGKCSVSHWKNDSYVREFMKNRGHIKAVLSVGGWGAGGFSDGVATKEGRELLTDSLVEIVEDYGFDGIDLDWEYPGIGDAGIDFSEKDPENYTAWVQLIRDKIGKDKLLTMAVGAWEKCLDNLELDKLVKLMDFFNLMSYDMTNGSLCCHHTSLYESALSQSMCGDKAVRLLEKAGIPLDKIVLGAAFYARIFSGAEGINKPHDGNVAAWSGGYANTLARIKGELMYDETAEAPYAFNPEEKEFITFDNPRSLKAKCEYVKKRKLYGIMFWEYTCDDDNSTLLKAIG